MADAGDAKSDLLWVVLIFIGFGLLWLVTGGPGGAEAATGPFLGSGLARQSELRRLPTTSVTPTADLPAAGGTSDEATIPLSPWRGKVRLSAGNARYEFQPNREYIVVEALSTNEAPINISGWQLVNNPVRRTTAQVVQIPLGVKLFVAGQINTPREPVLLAPGARAAVVTGRLPSLTLFPSSVSFQVNRCSGYLERLPYYNFSPSLSASCPRPLEEREVERLADDCYDFVKRLAACQTPKFERRADGYTYVDGRISRLDQSCRQFIESHYSYQSCVAWHALDDDFYTKEWRVFLNQTWQLWEDNRETIALYDDRGRLVQQISY